ncbi:MAG: HD domain-containing protein [Longimicrobiales bacterium]|nr:HD domain-containing protein [Longimicrobiales bacterium]
MSELDKIPTTVEEFLGLLSEFPEFDNMAELFHNPNYHPEGDSSFKAHMIAVFEKWHANPNRTAMGFWAMVFHDIGKQATARLDKERRFHSFIKHELVGAEIFVDKYLDYNNITRDFSDHIEWIIQQHTNFWQVAKLGKSLAIVKHPAFEILAEVCLADKMGLTLPGERIMDEEWDERVAYFVAKREANSD